MMNSIRSGLLGVLACGLTLLLGGRFFCSWVCPYHFLADLGESIHKRLIRKKSFSATTPLTNVSSTGFSCFF